MTNRTLTLSPLLSGSTRPARPFWRLFSTLGLALSVRKERRALLAFDEHSLKDLGCDRSKASAEAHRGFWDLPASRLPK